MKGCFQEPPHEISLIKTSKTHVNISLDYNRNYFISIMPYDLHGESVGKVLYQMSEEIKVKLNDDILDTR